MREEILERIDIKDIIAEDAQIVGNKIRCPFPDHDDKDPSFVIYDDGFYCFGCQRGGTVIDYVMYQKDVTAGEAMQYLCEKYHIPMRQWSDKEKKAWEQEKREKDVVFKIFSEVADYFHSRLTFERREYFHRRGLTDKIIDELKLGYADGTLYDAFKKKIVGSHNDVGLSLSGLFVKFEGGTMKDAYKGRYIFPYWKAGKVVYFIGRLDTDDEKEIAQLPKWNRGKYKKLATFHKEKHPFVSQIVRNDYFYGEDSIGEHETGIITEGVVDCIHLLQADYSCISPVTEEFRDGDLPKLGKLSKSWKTVYIVNDNEESGVGERGAEKTGQYLFENGADVRIVTLPRPEGVKKVDVADFLNVPLEQYPTRKQEFQFLLDSAPEFIQFKVHKSRTLLDDVSKREATREILELLTNCNDELQLDFYASMMQEAGLVKNASMFHHGLKDAKIQKAKKKKEALLKVVEQTDPTEFLKLQIKEIRKSKNLKAFEINEKTTHLVLNDMRERGRFYKTSSNQYYWFEKETKILHWLGDDVLEAGILIWYGINGSEKEYEYVMKALKAEAVSKGMETEIHQFAFYSENKKLYIYNNNDQVYRLDGSEIKLVDNGTDGVLFLKNQYWEPFEYKEIGDTEYLAPLIIGPINFVNGEHVLLNKKEQSLLFLIWIYSLFFESIQPTKPIMALIGPKGSGKTTVQRLVGQILLGRHFNVTPITKDEDFDAAISNNAFVFFDQVDNRIKWLNDHLAHTATGKMIQKRELYTTNQNVYFFPKCFIALNAREPKFKRDDVVDRLLLFRVERLPAFHSDKAIIQNSLMYRNELMSELMNDLNDIVAQLQRDNEPFATQHRMADWAEFGWHATKVLGLEDIFIHLLEKMDQEQSEFLLEDHPIFLCLDAWMLNPDNHNREVDSGTLFNEFQTLAKGEQITFPFENTIGFAINMRNIISNIAEFFDVQAEKKKKRWTYIFSSKLPD